MDINSILRILESDFFVLHTLVLVEQTIIHVFHFTFSSIPLNRFSSINYSYKLNTLLDRNDPLLQILLGDDGVLLCPPHPTTAPYNFQSFTKPINFVYASVFNALGMPVTTAPLGINCEGLPLGLQVNAFIKFRSLS